MDSLRHGIYIVPERRTLAAMVVEDSADHCVWEVNGIPRKLQNIFQVWIEWDQDRFVVAFVRSGEIGRSIGFPFYSTNITSRSFGEMALVNDCHVRVSVYCNKLRMALR
jgi:hypothetical protein